MRLVNINNLPYETNDHKGEVRFQYIKKSTLLQQDYLEFAKVTPNNIDYPEVMRKVSDDVHYDVIRFNNELFIPLFQVISLIEKENQLIPQKINYQDNIAVCPNCGLIFEEGEPSWKNSRFCRLCGQRLNWE